MQDETVSVTDLERIVFTEHERSTCGALHAEVLETLFFSRRPVTDTRTGKTWRVPRFIQVDRGRYRVATRQDMMREVLELCSFEPPTELPDDGLKALRALIRACGRFSASHVRARFNALYSHEEQEKRNA
jgi:hypothetical protein